MNAWSHLPNAAHINTVLKSIAADQAAWAAVGTAPYSGDRRAAWDAAHAIVMQSADTSAALTAARLVAYRVSTGTGRDAVMDAILSLIAYPLVNSFQWLAASGGVSTVDTVLMLPAITVLTRQTLAY